jgi:hypothetical protein
MAKAHPGRNDPCPCGSGRKYKHCCLHTDDGPPVALQEFMAEFHQAMESREFESLEEAQAFADNFVRTSNASPSDEFLGLSPDQMSRFLGFPFDSPDLWVFPTRLDSPPSAPILTLFQMLVDAIGEKGLKTTATGNLPRKFVQEAALQYSPDDELWDLLKTRVWTEPDFDALHTTRIVAELAGLIRKYKGKFILSRDCRKILAEQGLGGIYPRLLRAYAGRFNWGYRDRYQEIPLIQDSFLFTLFVLSRYGNDWRQNTFYEDAFLKAFPLALEEVEPRSYMTPEEEVRSCYSRRCLQNFAVFLGLTEIKPGTHRMIPKGFELRKTPLLDQAVIFNL